MAWYGDDLNMTPTEIMICADCAATVRTLDSLEWDAVELGEHDTYPELPADCAACGERNAADVEALAYTY